MLAIGVPPDLWFVAFIILQMIKKKIQNYVTRREIFPQSEVNEAHEGRVFCFREKYQIDGKKKRWQ